MANETSGLQYPLSQSVACAPTNVQRAHLADRAPAFGRENRPRSRSLINSGSVGHVVITGSALAFNAERARRRVRLSGRRLLLGRAPAFARDRGASLRP